MITLIKETAELAVCVKSAGIRAQGEGENDLPTLVSQQLGCAVYPVHRLDQAVGGAMVFAKTARAAARLSQAMAEGKLQKEYLAIVSKRPEKEAGVLEDLLFHDRFKNKTYVVDRARKGVKKAALCYRVLAEENGQCLVHICLFTGRTHQIRVQFASRGWPLVGDGKYGSRVNASSPALWSYALTLPEKGGQARVCVLPEKSGVWAPFSEVLAALTDKESEKTRQQYCRS